MSQSRLPLAVVSVPVGKRVFACPLLQVRHILSLVFAPGGFAQVLALALAQPGNPVPLIPVSILPLHHSISIRRLVLPAAIVHQPRGLVVTSVLKCALSFWVLGFVDLPLVASLFIPNPRGNHGWPVAQTSALMS